MKNLDKFYSLSDTELSEVDGGDNADYNMGYECGRDFRRWTNGLVYWWNHR